MMIGAVVHAQLDALEVNDQGDHFLGYGEQRCMDSQVVLVEPPLF